MVQLFVIVFWIWLLHISYANENFKKGQNHCTVIITYEKILPAHKDKIQ